MQFTLWSLPSLAAVLLSLHAAREVRRRAPVPGAPALLALCGSVFLWALGQLLGTLVTGLPEKMLASRLQYPGIALLAPAWLAFALTYARRPPTLGWKATGALCALPVVTIALAWTNDLHGAVWADARLATSRGFVGLTLDYGPWFAVHVLYSYALIVAGTALLVYELAPSPNHRRALTAVIAAPALVAALNLLHLGGLNPLPFIDPTPFGFAIGSVVLAHGVLHSGLLDLSPVLHRQVLEQLDDGVIVLDAEGRIIDVNASAAAMLMPDGGSTDTLGVAIDTLLPGQALSRLITSPERVLETEVDLTSYEVRATRLDAGGGSSATVLVFRDVTRRLEAESELKRAKQEMERLAYTDPLTGLENRRAFVSRLQEECDRVRRFDQQLSIVLLDLDRFKQINDTWGHETGDTVLRHVAEELHGCSRTCDVAGRLGGEEFALLLPGSGAEGALRVAERLREAVRRHRPAADAEPVTVSIGVATADPDAPDWQALLRAADEALYAAKHAGRNTVRSAAPN